MPDLCLAGTTLLSLVSLSTGSSFRFQRTAVNGFGPIGRTCRATHLMVLFMPRTDLPLNSTNPTIGSLLCAILYVIDDNSGISLHERVVSDSDAHRYSLSPFLLHCNSFSSKKVIRQIWLNINGEAIYYGTQPWDVCQNEMASSVFYTIKKVDRLYRYAHFTQWPVMSKVTLSQHHFLLPVI